MNFKYIITTEDSGKDIKYILKYRFNVSTRLINKLKQNNKILLNGKNEYVIVKVSKNDILEFDLNFNEESDILAENIPIDIIHEDDSIIVIDKKPNMVVHPTCLHRNGTIANALQYHFNQTNQKIKIRPVSRLDRDTSGIILFAKNSFIQENLISQMKQKLFQKFYIGIVDGNVFNDSGTINLPIGRQIDSIMLRCITENGLESITHYKVLERYLNFSKLEFNLETGRTHQIRVHCKAIGHSLVGDGLYSDIINPYISRQALHSHKIYFTHPILQQQMNFKSDLPNDITNLEYSLKN